MTETLSSVGSMPKDAKKRSRSSSRATPGERAAVAELVKAARARGDDITGPEGLLKSITATVLETALEEEMTDHLGHAKNHEKLRPYGVFYDRGQSRRDRMYRVRSAIR